MSKRSIVPGEENCGQLEKYKLELMRRKVCHKVSFNETIRSLLTGEI